MFKGNNQVYWVVSKWNSDCFEFDIHVPLVNRFVQYCRIQCKSLVEGEVFFLSEGRFTVTKW